jgi:sodium pump decarboxylase gamma subunit
MHVLERFTHADTFAQMELGEKLLATGYVIILGMGITFVALILIWALTSLMSKMIQSLENKNSVAKVKSQPVAPVKSEPAAAVIVDETDDGELIAVITAAIAASLNTSMHNIRVSNIRRINDATPVWGKSGRNEVMNTRF